MSQASPPLAAARLRFLVVDDDADLRDVFSRFIERAGELASTASDGKEAIEVLQRESFDVMLIDLAMPRMGGIEVVRWLRGHPDVASAMRVIVVSAWSGENERVLKELGVDDVLAKPLRMPWVRDLVADVRRTKEAEDSV